MGRPSPWRQDACKMKGWVQCRWLVKLSTIWTRTCLTRSSAATSVIVPRQPPPPPRRRRQQSPRQMQQWCEHLSSTLHQYLTHWKSVPDDSFEHSMAPELLFRFTFLDWNVFSHVCILVSCAILLAWPFSMNLELVCQLV